MRLALANLVQTAHIVGIVVWLGSDFTVFALSLSLLDRKLPIAVRIDRARLAQRFDGWVLWAFLATPPLGIWLAWLRGYELFATSWLALKMAMLGVIFLIAVAIVAGAAGTTTLLEQIAEGSGDVERLERQLRKRVIGLAYPVLALHLLLVAMIFVAVAKWVF